MLEVGANIAVIFLVLQSMLLLIVLVVMSFAMAKLASMLRKKVVSVTPDIQQRAVQLAVKTEAVSDKVVEPLIKVQMKQARAGGMVRRALGGVKEADPSHEQ